VKSLWWLSFCDPERPTGTQFLGACIVQGADMVEAVRNAWANRCNPGGEVQGQEIPGLVTPRIGPHRIGVLMNRQEAEAFDRELQS
jgi:hypothetical protein